MAENVTFTSRATVTRPADTSAYTALDVIGESTANSGAIEFKNISPLCCPIYITSLNLRIDASAIPAGMANFLLYLYEISPASKLADNAAFSLVAADRSTYLGKIRIPTPVDEVATLAIDLDGINKQVKLAGSSLFAYLVTEGGYTPVASTVHTITLHAVVL